LFKRPQHQRIARVLECLDAELLLRSRCLFGGGTAIALAHGEYRESVDIDLICSSVDGYRELRSLVNKGGIDVLFRTPVQKLRDPRIDQYGIRCALAVDGIPIKLEIVFEGRVALADPGPGDNIAGVWTLAMEDKVATKLMANSDRWADDAMLSRDLIDLAMLTNTGNLEHAGVEKAKHAYGDSVITDLGKAKKHLLGREERLKACMRKMGITMPEDELWGRIERLHVEKTPVTKARPARGKRP
jgi:Nucleotidyl transferase AbiEii toxin, Type IV TA system